MASASCSIGKDCKIVKRRKKKINRRIGHGFRKEKHTFAFDFKLLQIFLKMKRTICQIGLLCVLILSACSGNRSPKQLNQWTTRLNNVLTTSPLIVESGDTLTAGADYTNFRLNGQFRTDSGATASLWFHTDGQKGYEVVFHGGGIDGSLKSGSLKAIRNLYRSLADDSVWTSFDIRVQGKNITVNIDGTDVVCYTEPDEPYRTAQYQDRRLGHGDFMLVGNTGKVEFRNMEVWALNDDAKNENDTMPAIDEQNDSIIRLQQALFPVIDYHVHLKGGLTKEQAHAKSMNYGINYGIAPNAGEGGIGRMLKDDKEVYEYFKEVTPLPFLRGVQGEGRRWSTQFSPKALGVFDYLFTDAMTIVDRGRICRLYHPEEIHLDGRSKEEYMDLIVDQIVKILTFEPVDIYANATYLPDIMSADYDRLWTQERIDRVLDVLERYHIALEISARYHIPSYKIVSQAKARGIKFTFGTNNEKPDFGRLEYSIGAISACHLTADDIWFPSMSRWRERPRVDYNHFGK